MVFIPNENAPGPKGTGAFCIWDLSNDLGTQSGFEQGRALRDKFGKFTGFYRALSFVVNDERALFGLFGGVFANAHQRIDDVVKSVHVVIVHHNFMLVGRFFSQRQICLFLNLFVCGHN